MQRELHLGANCPSPDHYQISGHARNLGRASPVEKAASGQHSSSAEFDRGTEMSRNKVSSPSDSLLEFARGRRFATILADPPWRFQNKTGKVAPERRRLNRYGTMTLNEISKQPVSAIPAPTSHLYLWCPNALLPNGLRVIAEWGFTYKVNIIWHKIRKDGGSDGRGVGFDFRNVTELILFGTGGKNARTVAPGRRQVNLFATRKREHSRKPDEQYEIIEDCSSGPFLELFARGTRPNWVVWETKQTTTTSQRGKPTPITRRPTGSKRGEITPPRHLP